MKKLTLIRHAKSDWNTGATRDVDRPLNGRGNKAAPLMAGRISERGSVPDLFVSSPARRAFETVSLLVEALEFPGRDTQFCEDIYEASLATLIEVVRQLPDCEHVALVGHNPGLSELGLWLCPQAPEWLPTCAVLELELAVDDWNAVVAGCAKRLYYDFPKKQQGADHG